MTLRSANRVVCVLLSPTQAISGASALSYSCHSLLELEALAGNLVAAERLCLQVSTNDLFPILSYPPLPLFHAGFFVLKAE